MYLTYEQYQEMGGTLDEATFNDYEFESASIVDWYTFNRLHNETEYPEALTRLMYHLIKLLDLKAQTMGQAGDASGDTAGGKSIASQSNDGVSISYNIVTASELVSMTKDEMGNAVKKYLNGVMNSLGQKLLYRGLYPGE